MSIRDRNDSDPFAGIRMPSEVLDLLRRRLTAIERSTDTLQVHLATERAEGVVEALEVLKMLKPAELENLDLIMENVSQRQVKALLL